MKVLIVGNGGREHALAWKLLRSPQVKQVICTPGNGGTASLISCQNVPLAIDDFEGIGQLALAEQVDLVVIGPELPLSLGITDHLQAQGLTVFGPTQAGARLEASKSWAKTLMHQAGIPTAQSTTFTDPSLAKASIETLPIVIKANGLAAGKGVVVASNLEEAHQAIDGIFSGEFGADNLKIVVEEYLVGQEVSVLALTDGLTIRALVPAQDHKPIGEGDTGPNTGGMGAYAPTPVITPELMERIQTQVLEPTLKTLQAWGIDYRGVIYAGLMVTPAGEPQVLEFNCRLGDPETQAMLALLATPLEELLLACCEQRLAEVSITWKPGVAVCVVIASGGYPGTYQTGKVITGLAQAEAQGAMVFHAGTKTHDGLVITAGGRVLGVTAVRETFDQAIAAAYDAVDCIQFEGAYCRRDIGFRVAGIVTS
ncbi:MAG: phosphoribosylamine--glycine ligase [Oscillatoriales cyanobacterium RM2_1_1]|nr:phosphoribosylamine--glycine ligase [Oscillatoriales cyanobacterium SM2_3_0]NJO47277.1 phosphoribosylamine--glycine ligase [Oscillatoriales cyanobacterium RM2_1_1]